MPHTRGRAEAVSALPKLENAWNRAQCPQRLALGTHPAAGLHSQPPQNWGCARCVCPSEGGQFGLQHCYTGSSKACLNTGAVHRIRSVALDVLTDLGVLGRHSSTGVDQPLRSNPPGPNREMDSRIDRTSFLICRFFTSLGRAVWLSQMVLTPSNRLTVFNAVLAGRYQFALFHIRGRRTPIACKKLPLVRFQSAPVC